MADNVVLNSGSGGDTIATEDISGVEYQRIKLVDGTVGNTTVIPLSSDLTNGLDVDVTRVSGTVTVDGSAVTQPISGTVTANLSAVDNTVLDNIQAAVELIDDAISGIEMQVDVVAALPAGTNNIGQVGITDVSFAVADGNALGEGVLVQGDDGTDRKNINVDAITGDVQVDVTNTVTVDLGVNNDVTLNANSGVDIGDVDVLSLPASTNTIEVVGDAADGAAVAGNPVLVAGSDGTNAQTILVSSNGRQVFAAGAAAVDGGSNTLSQPFTSATQSFKCATAGHMFNGSTWDRIRGDTTNGLDVDVTRIAAGTNLVGDVGLSGARTSGGTTLYKNIDVDESEDAVKTSAGQIYWIHAMNLSNATRFLKFYNATVATVVVGTTVPDLTFPLPTQGDTNGAGFTLSIPNGIAFGTAITVAATTGVADNDSGAPGANEVVVNLGFA